MSWQQTYWVYAALDVKPCDRTTNTVQVHSQKEPTGGFGWACKRPPINTESSLIQRRGCHNKKRIPLSPLFCFKQSPLRTLTTVKGHRLQWTRLRRLTNRLSTAGALDFWYGAFLHSSFVLPTYTDFVTCRRVRTSRFLIRSMPPPAEQRFNPNQMDRHPHLLQDFNTGSVQEPWHQDRNMASPMSRTRGQSKSAWAKLTQTWTLEFGGFVAALLCLAATGALLWHYDNQLVPEWPVTLNFVLSLLGNVAFATTLFGVHASVAQCKWIWFAKRPRPMAELATFHDARESAIGALLLLFTAGTQ